MRGHINAVAEKNITQILKELNIYENIYTDIEVTEVCINTNKKIFTKKLGIGFVEKENESDNDKFINLLKILATLDNQQLTDRNPNISTKLILNNGQKVRIEGAIPPVVANPTINIRKQSIVIKTLESYLNDKFLTEETYDICRNSVLNHKNILIVGGTDTGKTTFLNSLLKVIELQNERTIIIEDTEELQMRANNVNRIQTIPNIFTPEQALKYCMRASPERVIFGEIRDGRAGYELISGFNSGHPGGISTIHADNGIGGLKKLEMYINSAYGTPMSDEIGMAIDIIITIKMKNYKRYLSSIDVCEGYNSLNNQYILKNLYSAEKDISFSAKEKERLIEYSKNRFNLDDVQLEILKRRKLEDIENYILNGGRIWEEKE
mgnify:FL=1